jgi:diguanylate cyclase (GGDEF)-like protein
VLAAWIARESLVMKCNSVGSYRCCLLVVDDDPLVLKTLAVLGSKEFVVLTADSAEAGQALFGNREIDLVLADQSLPGMAGVQFLAWVRDHSPKTIRLLMTGLGIFEDAVEAINTGQVYRYIFKPWRNEELLQILRTASRTFMLERSHDQLMEELRRLNLDLEERVQLRTRELEETNHQLQQQNWMLQKLALTDPLTALPNRRAMDRLARSEIRRRARYPGPLALGLIDVDHFKEVNAQYLLPGGDQVLAGLARTYISSLRTVDTVGRIGGEEFMLVAPETSFEGAATLGERIRAAVESSQFQYNSASIRVTVSLGFAVAELGVPIEFDQVKHVAADALAEAKCKGRNRCVVRLMPPSADTRDPSLPQLAAGIFEPNPVEDPLSDS